MKKTISLVLVVLITMLFALPACASADGLAASSDTTETSITLSDNGIKVDGAAASTSSSSAVYVGADIVYYEEGHDSTYGEGTAADEHSASEAQAHTVVTITKAGTYRLSGTLSAGQVAVDLGENAASDPAAVVTLILDGANITSSVAPAVIFYQVYECGSADTATASATVDTTKAGANVIIADGSVNNINGSYVARIYKEGTTKKLHKYDGAFYAKMSMNVSGGALGSGVLNIVAENEGLDSELHLTVNGGIINITAQNDGINTNEDGVSVTTINGGTFYINAGFGAEGDGIDSNGFLVINGGTIVTLANPKSGDGGIDADGDILINGGTVIALGSRNDAVSANSGQAYMELSYATTQQAGSLIRIEDAAGKEILTFNPAREYQSVTVSSPNLSLDTTYHIYSGGTLSNVAETNGLYAAGGTYTGGTLQQYTGTGMTGGPGGGMRVGMTPADGAGTDQFDGSERPTPPDGAGAPPTDGTERPTPADGAGRGQFDGSERPTPTDGMGTPPQGFDQNRAGGMGNQYGVSGDGSTEFTLTTATHSFSGVSDSAEASGKKAVTFTINNGGGMESVESGKTVALSGIAAKLKSDGSAVGISESDIQITITDIPSENYAKTCLLSAGAEAIASILPTEDGSYQLIISVLGSNATYTGTGQWMFSIGR